MERVAVTARVGESLEHHEARALGREQAVGVGVKRAATAALAQRAQGPEAHVNEEVVGAVDRARQHHVGLAVVQAIAGVLDRVQRRRARGIERECGRLQPERVPEQQRGQAGPEAVARVHGFVRRTPHRLGERRHAAGGEAEVAEDRPGPRGRVREACVPQRRAPSVQRPQEHRVQALERRGRHLEPRGVELQIANVPASIRPDPVGLRVVGRALDPARLDAPAPLGRRGHAIDRTADVGPQGLWSVRAWQQARTTDDRDGGEAHDVSFLYAFGSWCVSTPWSSAMTVPLRSWKITSATALRPSARRPVRVQRSGPSAGVA